MSQNVFGCFVRAGLGLPRNIAGIIVGTGLGLSACIVELL